MTQAALYKAVRALGLTIRKDASGDYIIQTVTDRVQGLDGYATNDRDDALQTAYRLVRQSWSRLNA